MRTGIGRANGYVVRGRTEELQALLHGYTDGAAAAPQSDKKIGPESCFVDIRRKLE